MTWPKLDHVPIQNAYDIDPLIPLPAPPNPLPADLERDLIEHPGPESSDEPANP